MQWTVAYYEYQSRLWLSALADYPGMSPGASAYAHRKADMWKDLAGFAKSLFKANGPDNFNI